ncbi:MAG TPA: DUF3306 domain-containing protein [Alphaproteobacteria bacterium]|nr:DUF3306 domain-containing protein [Alphaproteobacteria bacterium]
MAPRAPKTPDQAAPAASQDEPFAQRWSRLKQDSRSKANRGEPEAPSHSATARVDPNARAPTKEHEEKPFDVSQLPSIEDLTADSDFAAFMRPGVPDGLRQQALRRMWALDTAISGPDWFEMHMMDFNAVPTFPEGLAQTLYNVGTGYLDKVDGKTDEGSSAAAEPKSDKGEVSEKPANRADSAESAAEPAKDGDGSRESET